jgi:oligosaccharide repeat unit polymerase
MFDIAFVLPLEYWLCAILIAAAVALAVRQRHVAWVPPFVAVLGTIAGWYMVEPLYFRDEFALFTDTSIATAFRCVFLFVVTLIIATPVVSRWLEPRGKDPDLDLVSVTPEQIVPTIVVVWIGLLLFGIWRMEGDVFATLFPLQGRSNSTMWQRAAGEDAGPTGFVVSAATYVYVLILSLFGLLLPITRKPSIRGVLIVCIAISWPYAILQGSRNITLAVITPMIAAYLLLGRRSPLVKTGVAIGSFVALDLLMRLIIGLRDVGFEGASLSDVETSRHAGLNMASELVYMTELLERNFLDLAYGKGYLDELANVIPRVLWPGKPYIGIEYAIARGFGGGESDIGVFATLSPGVVGQGVLEFGTVFGPMFSALLMAIWIAILGRLRTQGGATRIALFLLGLGLTFNLGRGITLLTLYPFVFASIGVALLERHARRKNAQAQEFANRSTAAQVFRDQRRLET